MVGSDGRFGLFGPFGWHVWFVRCLFGRVGCWVGCVRFAGLVGLVVVLRFRVVAGRLAGACAGGWTGRSVENNLR